MTDTATLDSNDALLAKNDSLSQSSADVVRANHGPLMPIASKLGIAA